MTDQETYCEDLQYFLVVCYSFLFADFQGHVVFFNPMTCRPLFSCEKVKSVVGLNNLERLSRPSYFTVLLIVPIEPNKSSYSFSRIIFTHMSSCFCFGKTLHLGSLDVNHGCQEFSSVILRRRYVKRFRPNFSSLQDLHPRRSVETEQVSLAPLHKPSCHSNVMFFHRAIRIETKWGDVVLFVSWCFIRLCLYVSGNSFFPIGSNRFL